MLAYDPATNPLNTNEWAFPLCECLHIAAFSLSIGTIGLVDLRTLGLGIVERGPTRLLKDTEILTILGLIVVVFSGLAIFSSDPVMYIHNPPFQLKMMLLLAAIGFHYTVRRRIALKNSPRVVAISAAVLSLVIWWSLVFSGVFIGFY